MTWTVRDVIAITGFSGEILCADAKCAMTVAVSFRPLGLCKPQSGPPYGLVLGGGEL